MLYNVMDIKNTWFKRESNEKKIYSESLLWYRIKQILNDAGYDVIKKCPEKDGHMLSDPYYIRDRKWRFALTDNFSYARFLNEAFNEGKEIRLLYNGLED